MKKRRRKKGSVRGRLQRLGLGNPSAEPEKSPGLPPGNDLRRKLERLYGRRRKRDDDTEVKRPNIPAVPEDQLPHNQPLELDHRHPLSLRHGHLELGDLLERSSSSLAESAPRLLNKRAPHNDEEVVAEGQSAGGASFDPTRALFMDTETTGLAGGAGSLVFLIGFGWFEDDAFVVRQALVDDYGRESPALTEFVTACRRSDLLITFNGKAFDVDRLRLRLQMNGIPHELDAMPHLDLLHPSRRLLGSALAMTASGCSLKAVEQHYLGFTRIDDVPGSEAPARYQQWLTTRDNSVLQPVLEHNRLDILSLVTLTTHLLERAERPVEVAATEVEAYSAARFLLNGVCDSDDEDIICGFRTALSGYLTPPLKRRARRDLSLLLKRRQEWSEAVALWQRMVADRPSDAWALRELAKAFEHRLHDLAAAEKWATRLVKACDGEEQVRALHRLERIRRRRGTPPIDITVPGGLPLHQ